MSIFPPRIRRQGSSTFARSSVLPWEKEGGGLAPQEEEEEEECGIVGRVTHSFKGGSKGQPTPKPSSWLPPSRKQGEEGVDLLLPSVYSCPPPPPSKPRFFPSASKKYKKAGALFLVSFESQTAYDFFKAPGILLLQSRFLWQTVRRQHLWGLLLCLFVKS